MRKNAWFWPPASSAGMALSIWKVRRSSDPLRARSTVATPPPWFSQENQPWDAAPGRPAALNGAVGSEIPSDAIQSAIRAGRIVDHEHDQVDRPCASRGVTVMPAPSFSQENQSGTSIHWVQPRLHCHSLISFSGSGVDAGEAGLQNGRSDQDGDRRRAYPFTSSDWSGAWRTDLIRCRTGSPARIKARNCGRPA